MPPKKTWTEKYQQQGASMEITEHLDELRDRIIWSLLGVVLGVVAVGFPFQNAVLYWLEKPFKRFSISTPQSLEIVLGFDDEGRLKLLEPGNPDDASTTATASLESPDSALKRLVESEAESDLQAISVKLRLDETRSLSLTPQNETSLYFFNPIEPFLLRIKVILLTGILAALPIILWNVWKFVSPGLTDQERRLVRRGLQGALFLFPAGVLFAYYSVGFAIYFLLQYGEGFVPAIGIVAYLNMVLLYMVVMGLVFEFPLVLLLLVSMGVINTSALAANRPYVLLGLLVFSAILTPPEPFTMLLMAAPLYFLFEISLMMARVIERRTQKPRTDSE